LSYRGKLADYTSRKTSVKKARRSCRLNQTSYRFPNGRPYK